MIIKKHPLYGEKLLSFLGFGEIAKNIALYHHEHFNGMGYPKEISGALIPLEARIIALADVYDALRQPRSYKRSFSHKKAINIIKNQQGKQFDEKIVMSFLKNNSKFDTIFKTKF